MNTENIRACPNSSTAGGGRRRQRLTAVLHVYVLLAAQIFTAVGCSQRSNDYGAYKVGPTVAGRTAGSGAKTPETRAVDAPRLDVIIPVFDPGLSEEDENYEGENVWPELRRAEANRFATRLQQAMQKSNVFGAVRVAPDQTASGELYVLGTIIESNGSLVEIELDVVDASGKLWMSESFSHKVKTGFHKNIRNKAKDSYDPVFEKATAKIIEVLSKQNRQELEQLRPLAELRFGQYLANEPFDEHLRVEDNVHKLVSLPSEQDAMLKRVRAARVREQLFMDDLQSTYTAFSKQMDTSYLKWQEASLLENAARREARNKSIKEMLAGVLLIGGAIAAGIAAGNAKDNSVGEALGATGAVVGGVAASWVLSNAFKSREEAKFHQNALNELGTSLDLELAPRVVKLEKQTVELQGDASEQFAQWRIFLKKVYEQEKTPDVTL